MISQTAEYALRAVVFLAGQNGQAQSSAALAAAMELPQGYLAKVLQRLSQAGIVQANSGRRGGYVLNKNASELTTLEVLNAIDPLKRIETCPLKLEQHYEHLCVMHSRLNDATDMVERTLQETTISDLLKPPRRDAKRCRFPIVPADAGDLPNRNGTS